MPPPSKSELRERAVAELASFRVTYVNAVYELEEVMRLAEMALASPNVEDQTRLTFKFQCSRATRECKGLLEAGDRSIASNDNAIRICALAEVSQRVNTSLREVQVTATTLRLLFRSEHARCFSTVETPDDEEDCHSPLNPKLVGHCAFCGATFCPRHIELVKEIASISPDAEGNKPKPWCDQCGKEGLKESKSLQLEPDMNASEMEMRMQHVLEELKKTRESFRIARQGLLERLRD